MGFLRSEFRRWGVCADEELQPHYGSLTGLDGPTRDLFETFLRRGVLMPRHQPDAERTNYWMSPGQLVQKRFRQGQLIIGKLGDTYIGHRDDRPIIMIAGSRAGKSSTILDPNLFMYGGSMLVLDPKRELCRTAAFRRAMGHDVYCVDPYGDTTACFNPLDELDPGKPTIVDDVMSVANALVPDLPGASGNAKHFTDSARKLLEGLTLLTMTLPESERNLITVRELLTLSYPPLMKSTSRQVAQALAEASKEGKQQYFDANTMAMRVLLTRMKNSGRQFGGVLASIGSRFLNMGSGSERSGVFSTAAVATDFINSLMIRRTLRRSDFNLGSLRDGKRPVTIFLTLPVGRMEHYRWLRLIVQLACMSLERQGEYPRDRLPILFMLEEFATLGSVDYLERAAAYFPSFGIQPWYVLQGLGQLKRNYKDWQSFLGNAGLVQLFSNGDKDTIDYAMEKCGKLIAPWEEEAAFARERMSQLLLFKGEPPAAAMRLSHEDVANIREHAARGIFSLPRSGVQ